MAELCAMDTTSGKRFQKMVTSIHGLTLPNTAKNCPNDLEGLAPIFASKTQFPPRLASRILSICDNRRDRNLAEFTPGRSLGYQLHSGKRDTNFARQHSVSRLSVSLCAAHFSDSDSANQADRPCFLAHDRLLRDRWRDRLGIDLAHCVQSLAPTGTLRAVSCICHQRADLHTRHLLRLPTSFLRLGLHVHNSSERASDAESRACPKLVARPNRRWHYRNSAFHEAKPRASVFFEFSWFCRDSDDDSTNPQTEYRHLRVCYRGCGHHAGHSNPAYSFHRRPNELFALDYSVCGRPTH